MAKRVRRSTRNATPRHGRAAAAKAKAGLEVQQLIEDLRVNKDALQAQNARLLQAQRDLETSRDRYASLYDFAPIAYLLLDSVGVIRDVNLTGIALLGVSRAHVVGLPLAQWIAADSRRMFLDYLHYCRRSAETAATELRLVTAHAPRPVRLVTRRESDDAADRPSLRMAILDLTEQRQLEAGRRIAEAEQERMAEAERMARADSEAKDRFLATLSHELRTPLTPVLAAANGLAGMEAVPASARPLIETIRRNVKLEARLIDDLLDVTRIVQDKLTLEKEVVDVHTLVDEALAMCAGDLDTSRITWTNSQHATAHHVSGDADRLRQVFCNLIVNARKFTAPDGDIRVQTRTRPEDDRLEVVVSDTGSGMTPETLTRIFQPFAQGPNAARPVQGTAGLGLGLAISQGLVRAHGGTIEAFSHGPGTGSTFVVTLPTAAAPARAEDPAPVRPSPSEAAVRPLHVLLVEDHEDSAEMLSFLLTAHGHDVQIARTAGQALAQIAGHDLIVSDLGLPDMSGLEMMRKARGGTDAPAIALSGYGTEVDRQRSRDAGFQAHLTKPVEFDKLMETIGRVVAKHEQNA